MPRHLLFVLLLVSSLPAAANSLRVGPQVILDLQGFGGPLVAATLFVPVGWETKGGVEWGDQHACTKGYGINWQASSPDGQRGIAAFPHKQWEWNQLGAPFDVNCKIARIDSAESYLRSLVQQGIPGARVVKVVPRADLTAKEAQFAGVHDDGFQRVEKTVSAAQIFIAYEEKGIRYEGSMIASVLMTYTRTGGNGYGNPIESWTGYAGTTFASWGPAGQYNAGLYESLRNSYLPGELWSRKIAGHNSTMDQIALKGVIERGKIWRNTAVEINQIITESWANQQRSADYRAREFLESIRGVETYSDADAPGGTVQLSSSYDQAWKLEDGTYVLTSDPSFNPYEAFGVSGSMLGVAP